ncbi:unconventional myosin-XV [Trichonephila clavata]|uniref:Unconventional myosin-XV n=1 Tax=Trichonephila clavata TaxID=2740835 RepID=A0A8X6JBE7_TRICU|nr:unconventional myosin-XV [Trichonephila clavata]
MLDRIIGERLEEAEAERQQLEHEAERQRLEREAEQRRLEREAEAEQRQIELQRLEIRLLELQAAPAATTPPGRTEEVHHKIPLAQITPKFDEKKDEMSLFLVNFERRAEMARVPREEWAKAPEDIKDHFFGEWLELKQPEELANKFDEFESLKDSLRNNHHGRKQNESRPSHNDKSRFQDNRRKLSDNHARFRDNRGKYNDNHGRSTENHTRFYDKRQTKTEPGGRGSMPAQSKTSGQKNFRCYECDSPDHLRNSCPELRRSQGNEINTHSDTHPIHIVNEVPEEAIEYPDVDLQKFTRQVKIGDFVVTALLDTGSVRNLIRFDVYKRMNLKTKLWRESTVLTGLGQGQVKTLGSFRHVAEIDGHVCRLDFQVVPSAALKFEAIIGSAFLAHAPCPFHEEKVKPESPDWIFNISKKEEQDELDLRHIQNAEIAFTRERRKERIRSSSHERLLDDTGRIDPPLSKTSALNDRTGGARTLGDQQTQQAIFGPKTSPPQQRPDEELIHSKTPQSPPASAWQDELGLASSALNDRYFSRQELMKQTKTDASDAGSRREGSGSHGATPSIDESSKINGHSPDINGSNNNRDASNSSQASNDGIDFPEFDFPENGDEEEEIEPDDYLPDPDGSSAVARQSRRAM